MKKGILLIFGFLFIEGYIFAQIQGSGSISLTSMTVPYVQDFNTLASPPTSSSNTLPTGWYFAQTGVAPYTVYFSDDGSSNVGGTYSYGKSQNRSFGVLRDQSAFSMIGSGFSNNTGSTITQLNIAYTGKQWNSFLAGGSDKLIFEYSTNATSISSGTWIAVNPLDFLSINATGTGPLDGDAPANSTSKSFSIGGLNLINGSTFWIRWRDFQASLSGPEDGLAIDNFSIQPLTSVSTILSFPVSTGSAPTVNVSILNPSTTVATTVQVALIGGTGLASDLNLTFPLTLTFPANSTANQFFKLLPSKNPNLAGYKTYIFQLQNASGGTNAQIDNSKNSYTKNNFYLLPSMNSVLHTNFDEVGNLVAISNVLSDGAGKVIQIQNRDPQTGKTFVSEPLYDALDRKVGSTLPAPTNDPSIFYFHPNFFTNSTGAQYDYKNFDGADPLNPKSKTNSPDPVANTQPGTLGWYYSANNNLEPYVAENNFPYSRIEYYEDGSGEVKRSSGTGDEFKMGMNRDSYSASFPVANELDEYLKVRKIILPGLNTPTTLAGQAIKQVVTSADKKEAISFMDKSGHALASCLAGSGLGDHVITYNNQIPIPMYWSNMQVGCPRQQNYGTLSFQIDKVNYLEIYYSGALIYSGIGGDISIDRNTFPPDVTIPVQVRSFEKLTSVKFAFLSPCGISPLMSYPVFSSTAKVSNSIRLHIPDPTISTPVNITGNISSEYGMIIQNLQTQDNPPSIEVIGSKTLTGGYYKISTLLNGQTVTYPPYATSYTNNTITVSYPYPTSNWSYNFYNDAGQLVASIAPEGVKQILNNSAGINSYTKETLPFISTYEYDLQGRLIAGTQTDAGRGQFIYRKDGKIRFSQNASQAPDRYSYTNYDTYGRPVQSGEYVVFSGENIQDIITFGSPEMASILENTTDDGGLKLNDKNRKDWIKTHYDVPDATLYIPQFDYQQTFVNGGVSWTENINNTTWYSYDEQGKLLWMALNIKGFGPDVNSSFKTVEYDYDLFGNVNTVIYQKGKLDAFYHHYTYDAIKRLNKVETSKDGLTKTLQATYFYYLHGPLKRVEYGNKLQGMDYVYTAQGQLKSINHLDAYSDPGGDANDLFAEQMEYFPNDYTRNGTGITSYDFKNPYSYSGNVRGLTYHVTSNAGKAEASRCFLYDSKYQLKESSYGSWNGTTYTDLLQNKETNLTYDLNGNIQSLKRYPNSASNIPDHDFTYNYVPNTNKLSSVFNATTQSAYGSYTYNSIGQLSQDIVGGTTRNYNYDVTGKVRQLLNESNTNPKTEFIYNEKGQRINKTSHAASDQQTFYVRDNSGNVLAIYQKQGTGTPQLIEVPLYGSGRLGTYDVLSDNYQYELRDHLGTTMMVVGSKPQANAQVDILNYTFFYTMGKPLYKTGIPYRYGYQGAHAEQDPETGQNAFELRMYDPVIGRWTSPDPKHQHPSPYVGMGNNWANNIDLDGGEDGPELWSKVVSWFQTRVLGRYNEDFKRMANEAEIEESKWDAKQGGGYRGLDLSSPMGRFRLVDGGTRRIANVANQAIVRYTSITIETTNPDGTVHEQMLPLPVSAPSKLVLSGETILLKGFSLLRRVEVAEEAIIVHGNSLRSLRPTWGYKLFSTDETFLKNGITSKLIPETRYSQKFMLDKFMILEPIFPNRAAAYEWEFQQNQIMKGPLNFNNH